MTSLFTAFGDVDFPIDAGDVSNAQLFSVFDPGRDQLIAFFRQTLISELTAAWDVARVGTALSSVAVGAYTLY